MTPALDVSPTVGFILTTPLIDAGPMIDVSVSVPYERSTMFAETVTAEPQLEPSRTMLVNGPSVNSSVRKAGVPETIYVCCLTQENARGSFRTEKPLNRRSVLKGFRKAFHSQG